MPRPIRPSDIAEAKTTQIPEFVFEVFNTLIVKHWSIRNRCSRFEQAEVAMELRNVMAAIPEVAGLDPFEQRWLDVEDSYRAVGWNVEYDEPGYNEPGDARFTFSKKATRRSK